jgi:hypothetical protein
MTSIKPPSSGPTGPHTLPEAPDATGGTQRSDATDASASSSFQSTLDQAQAGRAASTGQVGATASERGADPIAQLAQSVETGSVTLDQAVERLLGQTLSKAQKHLSGEQLEELSGLLRDALLSDPTLSALRSARG